MRSRTKKLLQSSILMCLANVLASLALVSCSSNAGKPTGSDAGDCPTGAEACPCYGNKTCDVGLTCASNLCVALTGAGGSTGTGGSASSTGGATGAGGSAFSTGGATGAGGSVSTGAGGASSTGGATGAGGSPSCSCQSGQQCTTDGHCTNPDVIDDFWDCNMLIDTVAGRMGNWYAAADVGINLSFAVSVPPSGFSDKACGAWSTGGPTGNGTTNYGIMGCTLVGGALPYSLMGHSGLTVNIESGQSIGFVVKTSGNGYFQKTIGPTTGAQTYTVPFSEFAVRGDSQVGTLDLTQVTDIQFNVLDPTMGYGFAVHALSLY